MPKRGLKMLSPKCMKSLGCIILIMLIAMILRMTVFRNLEGFVEHHGGHGHGHKNEQKYNMDLTMCPKGEIWNGEKCAPPTLPEIPLPKCPVGKQFVNGQCVTPPKCPAGKQFVNGQCVAPPAIPCISHTTEGTCSKDTRCAWDDGGACIQKN